MYVSHLSISEKQCTIQLTGCNFECRGCFSPARYNTGRNIGVETIVEQIPSRKRILIAGGEPTLQKDELIKLISRFGGQQVILSTNGYFLDEDVMKKLEHAEVHIDLKAYTDDIHVYYTGRSNKPVLSAIKNLEKRGINFEVHTVLIPSIVDECEIGKIAQFFGTINKNIPLRIIRYVPVGQISRRPTHKELEKAVLCAETHLENVSTSAEKRNHPLKSEKIKLK